MDMRGAVPIDGGFPLVINGKIVGAIGVSGGSNTQDGQWLASMAQGLYDSNQAVVNAYNSFSPVFAQGAALSSLVKINGLTRKAASNSTADVTLVGVAGTLISNGAVGDNLNLGTQWALPASVTIPGSGTIDVTATCTTQGAITAAANTLTAILTPTLGWQTVANAAAATAGLPVESDAALRQRQAVSVALPALTPLQTILAAVSAIPNVGRTASYENDTGSTDANGAPPHSVTVVAESGNATAVATAIANTKNPGTATFGTTSIVVVDPVGVPNTIRFFQLSVQTINVVVTVKALGGFVSTTGTLIKQAVAAFISGLGIGTDVYLDRLFSPANLSGTAAVNATGQTQSQLDAFSATYNVSGITQAIGGGTQLPADIVIAFNQAAFAAVTNISVVVT